MHIITNIPYLSNPIFNRIFEILKHIKNMFKFQTKSHPKTLDISAILNEVETLDVSYKVRKQLWGTFTLFIPFISHLQVSFLCIHIFIHKHHYNVLWTNRNIFSVVFFFQKTKWVKCILSCAMSTQCKMTLLSLRDASAYGILMLREGRMIHGVWMLFLWTCCENIHILRMVMLGHYFFNHVYSYILYQEGEYG